MGDAPVAPMLARLTRALPRDGYVYEPKWDGFRCLVFRDGNRVELQSKSGQSLPPARTPRGPGQWRITPGRQWFHTACRRANTTTC